MRPLSLRKHGGGGQRHEDILRESDAAIEARVQALAAHLARGNALAQPDAGLIECLQQQITDLRTVQDNLRAYILGGEPSTPQQEPTIPEEGSPAAQASPSNPSTPADRSNAGRSSSLPGTPAADGLATIPAPSAVPRGGNGGGATPAELPSQGDFDRMSAAGVPVWDHEDEWWGASQYTRGRPVKSTRPSEMVRDVDSVLANYRTQRQAERAAFAAALKPPPQPVWRWTKFVSRSLFYVVLPVLYLSLRHQGEGRYTQWYELVSKAFTPPLVLCGAVELIITPRVIQHVVADQAWQPRTWGDKLQQNVQALVPLWLRARDDATGRQKKEDARASVALMPQSALRSNDLV